MVQTFSEKLGSVLERINNIGTLIVEKIRISEFEYHNFLISIAPEPIESDFILHNGIGKVLISTVISDNEMKYAIENGQKKLLDLFLTTFL